MRWQWKKYWAWADARPIDVVLRRRPTEHPDQLWLSLYAPDASKGARPVIEVSVELDDAIRSVPQACVVAAAGDINAGHAIVVVVGGMQFWPIYPATLRLRAPRL